MIRLMSQPTRINGTTPPNGMRIFSVIWFGQLVSTVSAGITSFALGIWLYQTTESVSMLALNMLFYTAPFVFLSPIAGLVADRWNRRVVMLLADLSAGLSMLVLFLLITSGNLAIWHIYVATIVTAAFTSFQWPAYSAAIPMLVPEKDLGRAGGMVQSAEAASYLLGPIIAGALFVLPTVGLRGILLIDFATLMVAVFTLMVVRLPLNDGNSEEMEKESFWSQISAGWAYILGNPGLLGLTIYLGVIAFLGEFTLPLIEPLLLKITTPDIMGRSLSLMAVGMVIGLGVMTIWGGPKRRVQGVLIPGMLGGLAIMLAGVSPRLALITVAGFLYFMLWPIVQASNQALWQSRTPREVLGRVMATHNMVESSVQLVALGLAGPLADRVFEPLMREGGALSGSVGLIIGSGDGRGIGLFFIILGLLIAISSVVAYLIPVIRHVEASTDPANNDDASDGVPTSTPETSISTI